MKCGELPASFGGTGEVAANGTALDTGRAEDRALTGEAVRIQDEGGVGANAADHTPSRRGARAHWRRLLSFV
jgi:hypothetical protein